MQIETIILSAGITILSLNLLIVSLLSFRKYKNIKLGLVSMVFFLFFLRGAIFSLSLFYTQFEEMQMITYFWLFDLVILISFYVVSLKR